MSRGARRLLFLVSAATLAGILVWGFDGLPAFGHFEGGYGLLLNRVAVPERHATDVVSAVVFDYRGFDTMGEEFILFAAAIGTALLLRETRGTKRDSRSYDASDSLRVLAAPLVGVSLVLGLDIVLHGYITPGGGFQGGTLLASAFVLAFLGGGFTAYRRVSREGVLDSVEGTALAAFAALGVAGLIFGSAFLDNVVPLGSSGTLTSAGTIAILNDVTALAVAAAFVLLFREFLEEITTGTGTR
jgi:multicomponent Na+:H+ antiporter subunit B